MKNAFKICYLFFCCSIFISCSEEKNFEDIKGSGTAPSPITELTAKADYGEVELKWKNPEDENFYYVNVVYTNSKGEKRSKNISKFAVDPLTGYVTDTVAGFANTNDYTFILTACNETGAASAPIEISSKPLTPPYELIIKTIDTKADFGGITVNWENITNKKANIVVSYVINGRKEQKTFDAAKSGQGSLSGIPATATEFDIIATDRFENESAPLTSTLTPYAESEITKTGWSIPGYNENSWQGTIGYSSQATNEGAVPNGRVMALLDDNIATFWHASWSPSTQYPHWFIIDLGKKVTISRVELTRRPGNNGTNCQIGQQFLTCTDVGAVDLTNPDTWLWEDQGEYKFDPINTAAQSSRLSKNPKARYLKVYFSKENKGKNDYAVLSDIKIFGSAE